MRYYLFNIGTDANTDEWWARLLGMGVITAGYDNMVGDKGDRALNSLDAGDWLIAYSKGNGAVGAGIVGGAETYRIIEESRLPLGYEHPSHRHFRDVRWKYFVKTLADAVRYRDLKTESRLRQAKTEIKDHKNAERIVDLLKARTQH